LAVETVQQEKTIGQQSMWRRGKQSMEEEAEHMEEEDTCADRTAGDYCRYRCQGRKGDLCVCVLLRLCICLCV
jgi:hypothetical protein